MNNTDLVRTALRELAAAASQPVAHSLDIVERWRPRIHSESDALSRAEFALAEGLLRATRRPPPDLMKDLARAVEVFQINVRPRQQAEALYSLGDWKWRCSQPIDALDCARRALQIPELPPHYRLRLLSVVVPAMGTLSCIDQAWDCYRLMFEPFMAAAPPSQELAAAHLDVANLHVMRAMKMARLRALGNMAEGQSVPMLQGRSPEMTAELALARERLNLALRMGGQQLEWLAESLAGSISALEGRLDEAFSIFGLVPLTGVPEASRLELLGWTCRINGRFAQALTFLEPALALATEFEVGLLVGMISLECAICYGETGDGARSAKAYAVCLSHQAGLTADQFPVDWMRQPVQSMAASPSPAPREAMLRAEPPHLRRALRLMRENLAPRLSLGELAESAKVRPRTLQASFRSYRDSTVVEAYREIAMQHAKTLLLSTDQPLSAVAAQSGHASLASFSRDFKQVFGLPPGQFRALRADTV